VGAGDDVLRHHGGLGYIFVVAEKDEGRWQTRSFVRFSFLAWGGGGLLPKVLGSESGPGLIALRPRCVWE